MTYHGVHARRRGMTKRGAQVVGPPLWSGVWDGPRRHDTSRTCWHIIKCEMNLPPQIAERVRIAPRMSTLHPNYA